MFYFQIHALATESFLDGKELFDLRTLQTALTILSRELLPDKVLPDASPTFRRKLASALFYKVLQEAKVKQFQCFEVSLIQSITTY
jgi:xanthine dehydrogenase/oxidase